MKKNISAAIIAVLLVITTISASGCVSFSGGFSDWFYDDGESSGSNSIYGSSSSDGVSADDGDSSEGADDSEATEDSNDTQKENTKFEQSSSNGKEALSVSEIYAQNVGSVAGITTQGKTTNIFGQQSTTASSGTGIVISSDGYIATNNHVVEGGDSYNVALYDGTVYEATLIGCDASNDVALLKIDATGLTPANLGDSDEIVVGEDVVVIGNPLGELTYTLTRGVVSALNRAINTDGTPINMFQIDAAVNSGNSGGPAFDAVGNVIGMVTAKYADESIEGLGFCIPINDVTKICNEILQYGYVRGKAALEVAVQDAYSSSFWGTTRVSGAYVSYVIEGGAADKAGLEVGSLINYVDNTAITGASDLSTILRSYSKGEKVTLRGYLNNRAFEIEVTLSEYSPDLIPDNWNSGDGVIC